MKKHLLAVMVVAIGFSAIGAARYTVHVDPRIYVLAVDPNDPIYKGLAVDNVLIPEGWVKQFGNNERAALLFHITVNRNQIMKINERLAALEPQDPNEMKGTP